MREANVQSQRLNIVFAGGGTGGHLFPALAIADEVRRNKPDVRITFIGTRNRIEARVVPQYGFGFEAIWISGFRRKWTLDNVLFPMKVVISLMQSFALMWKLKPQVVVGTGGYVCGPPLFAASLLGIPTLIQEQNSYPGVTTRLLAKRAREVHLSFAGSQRFLVRSDNVHVSGNPTRENVGRVSRDEGAAYFGLSPDRRTLLIFGGSLGAASINRAVAKALSGLMVSEVQVIWQTGESEFERLKTLADQMGKDRVKVYRFIDRMEYGYAACDLAVCRAGATTVAELAKAGVASVLVPYPFAAADHQTENAGAMVEAGAAVMVRDAELDEKLWVTVEGLLADPVRLQAMRSGALRVGNPDAAAVLARAVVNLAGARYGRN